MRLGVAQRVCVSKPGRMCRLTAALTITPAAGRSDHPRLGPMVGSLLEPSSAQPILWQDMPPTRTDRPGTRTRPDGAATDADTVYPRLRRMQGLIAERRP